MILLEPTDHVGVVLMPGVRVEERLVLTLVTRRVFAKELAGSHRVGREPGNGIELVIAHDRQRGTRFDHRPHDVDDFALLRAAIDKITEEDDLPVRLPVDTIDVEVTELAEEPMQWLAVSVDIADQVVVHKQIIRLSTATAVTTLPGPVCCHPGYALTQPANRGFGPGSPRMPETQADEIRIARTRRKDMPGGDTDTGFDGIIEQSFGVNALRQLEPQYRAPYRPGRARFGWEMIRHKRAHAFRVALQYRA